MISTALFAAEKTGWEQAKEDFKQAEEEVIHSDWRGGSDAGAAAHAYKQTLTEERINHLRKRYMVE